MNKLDTKRAAITKKYEELLDDVDVITYTEKDTEEQLDYANKFIREATEEQLNYADLAIKILRYCSFYCLFEYTDEDKIPLKCLTNALMEINNEKFIEALSKAKTAMDYLMLKVPNNDVLRYYIYDGQRNVAIGI